MKAAVAAVVALLLLAGAAGVVFAFVTAGGNESAAEPAAMPTAGTRPVETPDSTKESPSPARAAAQLLPRPTGLPPTDPVACPEPTVTVSGVGELEDALAAAAPGTAIALEDGTYEGEFVLSAAGTAAQPIFLCGSPGAILEGEGTDGDYVVHLDNAAHWRLVGFTVRNGQKGLMADRTTHTVIQGLTVEQIGDEAVHLRNTSTDNVVLASTIRDTGLRKEKFGEGVYVGTAESNWCDISDCEPDRSDRNVIKGNRISATSAESVDIKEGTTGGAVLGNVFDGAEITGADSWVDVKGNGWLIEGNEGRTTPLDGFQTHNILDDWGSRNIFRSNSASVDAPGYAIALTPVASNEVGCDNTVTGAGRGLSNTECVA